MLIPSVELDINYSAASPKINSGHSYFMSDADHVAIVTLLNSVKARTVIEIGIQEGLTAKALLRDVKTIEHYVGVDVMPGHVPSMPQQIREVPRRAGSAVASDPRVRVIQRPNGSLDLTPEDLPPCDAMLIDGDHGRVSVLYDTMLARALVRSGGVIMWHDYNEECTVDVVPVLDDLYRAGDKLLRVAGTWLVFERML